MSAGLAVSAILALETSCDDTCAALVGHDGVILANVISSQGIHARYGGVVPELAARRHLELVNVVVADALDRAGAELADVDLVAVTRGPGLIGALLVGLETAKGLAAARRLPLAGVDHLHGHIASCLLEPDPIEPPFLCLVASGGHTLLAHVHAPDRWEVLGRTLDDAAGEAFDKGARLLGLGFPGGPALERLATGRGDPAGPAGDPERFAFPTAAGVGGLDFSFAGLKTALLYTIADLTGTPRGRAARPAAGRAVPGAQLARGDRADLAASYERAIVEALALRLERALRQTGLRRLALAGGVAANRALRRRAAALGVPLTVPPVALCTDNAAMIASAARWLPALAFPAYLGLDAYPTSRGGL